MFNPKYYKFLIIALTLFICVFLIPVSIYVIKAQHEILTLNKKVSDYYVVFGDNGTGRALQYLVAESMTEYCRSKKCDSVYVVGDVINLNGVSSIDDVQFIDKFELPYKDVDVPFYIAFGNHDYEGCVDCYLEYSKVSKKWKMPAAYYTRRVNQDLEFFIINSESFLQEQEDWLQKSLKESTAKWKVVLGHRPLQTYDAAALPDKWKYREQVKESICNEADVYMAGHAHMLEDGGDIDGCKVRQLVVGGGGSLPRKVTQPNKNKFNLENNGFSTVRTNDGKFEYFFYDIKGKEVYRNTLSK